MAYFADIHSREYIKEEDLQKQILMQHPVPDNIEEPKILDPAIKLLLTGKIEKYKKKDERMCRILKKLRNATGPLYRVWSLFETKLKNSKRAKRLMDVVGVTEALQQTSMLLGQVQVALNRTRREKVLKALTSQARAKEMLTSHNEILEEKEPNNELLGAKFRDEVGDLEAEMKKFGKLVARGSHRGNHRPRGGPFRPGLSPRGGTGSQRSHQFQYQAITNRYGTHTNRGGSQQRGKSNDNSCSSKNF